MLYILSAWVLFIALSCRVGWVHQQRKTPEEQHLDLLIDLNDPYATTYAYKIFGLPIWGVRDDATGKVYALI